MKCEFPLVERFGSHLNNKKMNAYLVSSALIISSATLAAMFALNLEREDNILERLGMAIYSTFCLLGTASLVYTLCYVLSLASKAH